jgi:hypothetical protein
VTRKRGLCPLCVYWIPQKLSSRLVQEVRKEMIAHVFFTPQPILQAYLCLSLFYLLQRLLRVSLTLVAPPSLSKRTWLSNCLSLFYFNN